MNKPCKPSFRRRRYFAKSFLHRVTKTGAATVSLVRQMKATYFLHHRQDRVYNRRRYLGKSLTVLYCHCLIMRTSVAVASLAIVALAILGTTSANCVKTVVGVGVPAHSYSASVKNAASNSDAKTAEANKEDEAYTDGNIKYARGSSNTATSRDKDSAQSSVKKVDIKGIDGSSYKANSASVKTASLDENSKSNTAYESYGLSPCA
ncbi:hypothetical protein J6590_084705 [Homalodisca vitripennis]|nr:hypothetical protein J6590_084705 [Homalodisca vitripennis]